MEQQLSSFKPTNKRPSNQRPNYLLNNSSLSSYKNRSFSLPLSFMLLLAFVNKSKESCFFGFLCMFLLAKVVTKHFLLFTTFCMNHQNSCVLNLAKQEYHLKIRRFVREFEWRIATKWRKTQNYNNKKFLDMHISITSKNRINWMNARKTGRNEFIKRWKAMTWRWVWHIKKEKRNKT